MRAKLMNDLARRGLTLLATLGLGACAAQPVGPTPLHATQWRAVEIPGVALTVVEAGRAPHFVLETEGNRVSGFSGCNRLMGSYQLDKDALRFSGLASTRMGCPAPIMEVEGAFLKALNATAGLRQDGNALELRDAGGRVVMRLMATEASSGSQPR